MLSAFALMYALYPLISRCQLACSAGSRTPLSPESSCPPPSTFRQYTVPGGRRRAGLESRPDTGSLSSDVAPAPTAHVVGSRLTARPATCAAAANTAGLPAVNTAGLEHQRRVRHLDHRDQDALESRRASDQLVDRLGVVGNERRNRRAAGM